MESGEFSRQLGRELRALRLAHGLTAETTAQRIAGGMSRGALMSYERGDRSISVEKLAEIAAFYGVPAAELIPA